MKWMLRRVRGLIAAPPGPGGDGGEKSATYYDDRYRSFHVRCYAQSHYYFLWTVIADRIRRDRLKRVLEVGCGVGLLASFLFEQGIENYLGFDFSPVAIEQARRNAPWCRFLVADARTTGAFDDFEHDVVICTEVLEHIEDDLGVLARVRPGRRCLASVPSFPFDSHVRHFRDPERWSRGTAASSATST
jgi:2-polyprenyl-3-methyl-5-hydroxy-6-metoxy-1,4-benzoquinol methylase